jgi:hypothetical protein
MLSYEVAGGALPQPIRRKGTHMGHQPPSGSPPMPPEPPPSPAVPLPAPDPVARLALAGFLCGLGSFIASMLASLNVIAGLFLTFFVSSGAEPGLSLSEVLLLLIAAFPVALVGLILSVRGRHSTTRHRLARAGIIFSCIALLPFVVAIVVVFQTLSYCSIHSCI